MAQPWPNSAFPTSTTTAKSARTTGLKLPPPIRKRERQQQGFKSKASTQRFLTTHAAIYNTFYTARHLTTRPTLRIFRTAAFEAWSGATCA